MIENSDTTRQTTFRFKGRAPYRLRTMAVACSTVVFGLLFFISALGSVSVTLPEYGFVSIGEGRVALKLPEQPGGMHVQRAGPQRAGTVYFGRNWPFAQRYYIGGDQIRSKGGSTTGRWIDPRDPYLFWKPDLSSFPAFSSWPIWIPAVLLGACAIALRASEIRRWRKAECCPHCGYPLEGLEILHGPNPVCPECGGTMAHTREACDATG